MMYAATIWSRTCLFLAHLSLLKHLSQLSSRTLPSVPLTELSGVIRLHFPGSALFPLNFSSLLIHFIARERTVFAISNDKTLPSWCRKHSLCLVLEKVVHYFTCLCYLLVLELGYTIPYFLFCTFSAIFANHYFPVLLTPHLPLPIRRFLACLRWAFEFDTENQHGMIKRINNLQDVHSLFSTSQGERCVTFDTRFCG